MSTVAILNFVNQTECVSLKSQLNIPILSCNQIQDKGLSSSISFMIEEVKSFKCDYVMLFLSNLHYEFCEGGLNRMVEIAEQSGKDFVYFDLKRKDNEGNEEVWTLCDYQLGSLRDDFDFGEIVFIRKDALLKANIEDGLKFAAFYSLRLQCCNFDGENSSVFHSIEVLYTVSEPDNRTSGEKQFDYVAPNAREKQIEMERVHTSNLKRIGAFISPAQNKNCQIDDAKGVNIMKACGNTMSVVIPVKNRAKTIKDAVMSAANQKGVDYNIIVVDNYSNDGTSEILSELTKSVKNLVVLQPEQDNLQIGGCWMYAVNSEHCGDYAVQLDSDDVYSGDDTLLKVKQCFEITGAKMVIGTYDLTDFDLNLIPPGIIAHKEWTDDNGANNALRINGLGAPRAFVRDALRENPLPNVSYGEDYAAGLRFSRDFAIGRIYDVLYHCRRWGGNSDSSLSPAKLKKNNEYKDSLRTNEVRERMKISKK